MDGSVWFPALDPLAAEGWRVLAPDQLVDQRDALRSVDRPVLVVSGAHDRTTPAASAHELVEVLGDVEEVVLPNSAHILPYEEPDAFLAALRGFLARV